MPKQLPATNVQTAQPRNLVLCLDGTGNSFGYENTNVVKLFQVCERSEQQLAYYDPGVGTLGDAGYKTSIGRLVNKALGGATGVGLMRNVEEAYIYLMNNYQVGDLIFLFGFSRGAYTARVLAGFINRCGLFEKGSENLIPYAMKIFLEQEAKHAKDAARKPVEAPEEGGEPAPAKVGASEPSGAEADAAGPWNAAEEKEKPLDPRKDAERYFYALRSTFRRTYGRRLLNANGKTTYQLPIHFLGLWDTVKSHGRLYAPAHIPGEDGNTSVRTVRHAISLDEQRVFFPHMHWRRKGVHQDAREVWFAGVHQDVGGGYPESESGLSKIPLDWMLGQASKAGLRVVEDELQHIVRGAPDAGGTRLDKTRPDPFAAQHVSLVGPWRAAEVLPWLRADRTMCWRPRFEADRARQLPTCAVIHRSVVLRMRQNIEAQIQKKPAGSGQARSSTRHDYLPAQLGDMSLDVREKLTASLPALIATASEPLAGLLLLPLDRPAARSAPWAGEILMLRLSAQDHAFLQADWREDRGHIVRRLTWRWREKHAAGEDCAALQEALATVKRRRTRWPAARRAARATAPT